MAPEIEWITDTDRFGELAGEWDAVLPAESHPFDLHCWYEAWWEAFGAGSELFVCTVRRDGVLAGALPMRVEGGQLRGLVNSHSPLIRPLAADAAALRVLTEAALGAEPGLRELPGLPLEDPGLTQLRDSASGASRPTLVDPSYESPIVDTGGDFEAWRKQSKPRWGAPLERFTRKMGRDHEAELRIVELPEDLDAELEAGFAVEASGWKGEAGTAILSSPETELFYRRVAAAFAARDGLRLSCIRLDGEAVAFDLCLLHRERLYLLKTGFDERFRRLAPGLVMRLATIQRCFELGLAAHELLGEATEWKLKFATGGRGHGTLRIFPSGLAGRASYRYRKDLRPRLKRVNGQLRHGWQARRGRGRSE